MRLACLFVVAVCFCAAVPNVISATKDEWASYGHDPGGQRYSPLNQINLSNVSSLKVAWTFRTGDAYSPEHSNKTAFEATPLYVDNTLYLGTPLGRVIALDPVTGKQRWEFDGHVKKDAGYGDYANRGVSTWKAPTGQRRIFIATTDAQLISIDASTGKPCSDFGDNGIVDLRKGLRIAPRHFEDYEETSPPAIIGNTVVVGSGVADNRATDQPSGEVRAFDVVSGKRKWTWDPIPQGANVPGAETWKNGSAERTGAANAWSILTVDVPRNLIFVPTGSASPDYYGGERVGDNLFANSVVALSAETGQPVWHFQTVHHDLWDYDIATPPLLFDMHRGGQVIPAVAVGSKTGHLFLLNRETGQPIFGVEERPVPKSDVPGEVSSPTQPFPILPHAVSPESLTAGTAWGSDEANRNWCKEEIGKLRAQGAFTPPSLGGSLLTPGNLGGMAWGGIAYDPQNDLLILPETNMASEVRLIPRAQFDQVRKRVREQEGRNLNGDWEFAGQSGTPYAMMRHFLRAPNGLPCTPPPWGTLLAIQASTGEKKWEVPLGNFPKAPPGLGSAVGLGGPIVTAGGIAFTAGTLDSAMYGFNVKTGEMVWNTKLPTSARSTPMTYEGPDGKQYLVICAGGHGIEGMGPLGDYVIAFSLAAAE